MALETPIAFCIFNRPEVTRKVFRAIAKARPKTLLVIADGPRPDRPEEPELVRQTRAIVDAVDWPCEILKNYSAENLGCKQRMATGIDWAFQQFEELVAFTLDTVGRDRRRCFHSFSANSKCCR